MRGDNDRHFPPHNRLSSRTACSLIVQYFEVVCGAVVTRIQFQSSFQVPFCLGVSLHLNVQCSYSASVNDTLLCPLVREGFHASYQG